MTRISKTFAIAFGIAGLASFPLSAFAEDVKAPEAKVVPVDDDSISNEMSSCLQSALAKNDMPAVRDCDRFNPISPKYGQPAKAK